MTEELAARVAASPFAALGLVPALVRALLEEGYTEPTQVQREVIPLVLAGRDVLACAQTGTGKTAAFVLPLLQRLAASPRSSSKIRVLIVTPTRELASQIGERISAYGAHAGQVNRTAIIYGGVGQRPQEDALRQEPEIVVATPGRLLDLMDQGHVRLEGIAHLVLDEADQMLDMGFLRDVKRICAALPAKRETLLLSATMPADIEALARQMLVSPARVAVRPAVTTAERVEQSVVLLSRDDKRAALVDVLTRPDVHRTLVFTRTKHGANRLVEQLERSGVGSAAIHGNKSQNARERALEAFRTGALGVLVATDVAARGIDVEGVSHVVNFDLPEVPEAYVHRIGRTGRAGQSGVAISFCTPEERPLLADIERLIKNRIPSTRVEPGRAPVVEGAQAASPRQLEPRAEPRQIQPQRIEPQRIEPQRAEPQRRFDAPPPRAAQPAADPPPPPPFGGRGGRRPKGVRSYPYT